MAKFVPRGTVGNFTVSAIDMQTALQHELDFHWSALAPWSRGILEKLTVVTSFEVG
jgi:hypothetical protein